MLKITLPDKSVLEVAKGTTLAQLVAKIGPRLAKAALAARIDGQLVDLSCPIEVDAAVEIITAKYPDALEILRHTVAHILAQAVRHIYGDQVQYTIGPPLTDDFQYGFYYDFDLPQTITTEDLPTIEKEMAKIVKQDLPIRRLELEPAAAKQRFAELGQTYKTEMIDDLLRDEQLPTVSLYEQGDFTDLCRGPHLPSTGRVGTFKLLAVAGAYWRGDAANKMLTRIYGTAFFDKKQLAVHLEKLEKARKQDHRVLGRQLELFSVHADIGPGLIHWHPKAGLIRHLIESFWQQEHLKRGYDIVYTPHIGSERIFQISGHLEKYAEMMYSPMDIDGTDYYLRPMNCPGHIRIYQTRPHSYRELPLRYCELGTVYRYEPTGTLHGMLRVRGFTQDDSHIFCTPEQLVDEVVGVLELADYMLKSFGYTYSVYLATRPDNFLGTEAQWDFATKALSQALESRSISYEIDPGGGVFYAPKIDLKVNDSLGRQWQGPTIQVDLNLPSADRFNISYVGPDNAEHEVIMIHRTVLGSMERFVGGLIEHYGGAFPLWLAPLQAVVLPISEKFSQYAEKVHQQLLRANLRSQVNQSADTISAKIRQATLEKIPYMLIVGAKEVQAQQVALRGRTEGDLGTMALDEFVRRCHNEIQQKGSAK